VVINNRSSSQVLPHHSSSSLLPPPPSHQGLASLAAPFAIIHTAVAGAQKVCKKINRFQRWGPTSVGLAIIPFLPSLVDEPIEEGIHWAFEKYYPHKHPPATTTTTTHHHEKKE